MRQLTNDFGVLLTAKVKPHFLGILGHVKGNVGFIVILVLILQGLFQPAHLVRFTMDEYNVRWFDCANEFLF